MTNGGKILTEEHNIISLRTAYVIEVDGIMALQLLPAHTSMARKPNVYKAEFSEWLKAYEAFLYQDVSSGSGMPIRNLKHLTFEKPPELKLRWTDSGNSVAVYLDGEPWAFIDEHTEKTYSKGVLNSNLANPWERGFGLKNSWDQLAFEKTFAETLNGNRR